MKTTRISKILNLLISEKKIRVTELARRIDLPQPTVHRIMNGVCEHPHLSSLKPIADFFSISVDQLKGLEPIPWLDHTAKVPLLTWDQLIHWPSNKNKLKNADLILTDAKIGPKAYALKIKDAAMDPVFPKNTLLIADPDKLPRDRSYVITKLVNFSEPIFRQLLVDANDQYLKPLSPDFDKYKMTRITDKDKILSVVVQAKRDCEEQ